MEPYRLFVYRKDGQLIGPAMVIHAAKDTEAIAQAEAVRGSLAAEVLDVDSLRIVKYLGDGVSGLHAGTEARRSALINRIAKPVTHHRSAPALWA